ncbi:MAG: hypothetical protein E6G97_17335 [Alphaproteobacteria bacterium]|nr:MAG: hypothetical protein E6G97_17335 [Alphaproteobacteria bacterium]
MLSNMERLNPLLKRAACMAACLACWVISAHANDLDDFNRAVEAAMSHRRVAAEYLRTGNIDLAVLEIEGMREAWGKVSTLPRPAAFNDQQRYTGTILEIAASLVGISLVLNLGRPDVARESLGTVRASLSRLRRENGVAVLADCVLDANIAMDALFAHDKEPDWESVSAGAESYRGTLQRCDGMAPAGIRSHPEFRRLIDGAHAGLAQIPQAAAARDRDLLHRLLIELRSFDHLLAFRYG